MKINDVVYSKEYEKAYNAIRDSALRDRIRQKEIHLVQIIANANTFNDMGELARQSNTKPYRRANVHQDLEIYWFIQKEKLHLAKLLNHKEMKKYKDTLDMSH